MNLVDGDYIMSNFPLDETWELVKKVLDSLSGPDGGWQILEDRLGQRLTAAKQISRAMRLQRTLMIEINFYESTDKRVRLELHYTISPMFNIVEFEAMLSAAVDSIAAAINPDSRVYGVHEALPDELASMPKQAAGGKSMAFIEIMIVLNLIAFILTALPGLAPIGTGFISVELMCAVPVAIFGSLYSGYSNAFVGKHYDQQSTGQRVLMGVISTITLIGITVFALPMILFGLCVAGMMMASHK